MNGRESVDICIRAAALAVGAATFSTSRAPVFQSFSHSACFVRLVLPILLITTLVLCFHRQVNDGPLLANTGSCVIFSLLASISGRGGGGVRSVRIAFHRLLAVEWPQGFFPLTHGGLLSLSLWALWRALALLPYMGIQMRSEEE